MTAWRPPGSARTTTRHECPGSPAAGAVKGTALLVNDAGRKADSVNAERLLKAGYRVLAVDPFYFGESKIEQRDFLFAILVAAVGDRPLGI